MTRSLIKREATLSDNASDLGEHLASTVMQLGYSANSGNQSNCYTLILFPIRRLVPMNLHEHLGVPHLVELCAIVE
jgi:hypothetical protein